MRISRISMGLALSGLTLVAACATPAPPPPPPPPPAPPPVEEVIHAPVPDKWDEIPATPGNWFYSAVSGGTQAYFGPSQSDAQFILRCDSANARMLLIRAVQASGTTTMTIHTETAHRALPAQPVSGGQPMIAATLSPRDSLLDAMALSKGRFAVEVAGSASLYLPSWAEVSRAIEDCR